MRLGKATVAHFLSQVVVSVAGFVATFAIARVLGADGVGMYALGVAILMWLKIPAGGLRVGITKRISEGRERGEFLSAGILLQGVFGVGVALSLLAFAGAVDRYVGAGVATLIAAMFLADVGFVTVGAAMEGEKKVARYGWVRAFERVARTALQVGLILVGYDVAGLFFGHAVSLIIASVFSLALLGLRLSIPKRRHFQSLLKYARYSWLGGVKNRTFGWMDTIVLGFFVASSLVGIYEVAWTLASFLVLVANSIQSTLFPELSELSTDNRDDRIHHYINEGLVFTGIFLIPGFFGAFALGTDILRIYSPEFTEGAIILLILIAARTFDAYGTQLVSAINALDRPEVAFRINGFFVVVNMTLNVALIATFGWYGAAVATLLSGFLTLLLSYLALARLIGAPEIPLGEILRQIVAGGVMVGAVHIIGIQLPGGHYMTILLVGVGAAVYLMILLSLSRKVREKTNALVGSILSSDSPR